MRYLFLAVLCTLLAATDLLAQVPDVPTDYLPKNFHISRRDSLRNLLPANSVAIVFAYPTRNFSNDVDYVYHANPDLYYFTGYKEPDAMLFIFKNEQKAADSSTYRDLFFIRKRDAAAEQWTGRRLGVDGAKEVSGIDKVFNGADFKDFAINFASLDRIVMGKIPDDVSDSKYDKAELYDLLQQLKQKAAVPDDMSKDTRFNGNLYYKLTASLREVKTDEEMDLLRKAVEISCIGQREVMKAIRPDMSEHEIQGLHEYVHKKYGAEYVGYPSIVGAGENGCILHYEENTKMHIGQSLLLMDVGAEYHGYTADVTRTIPANGKFSADQRAIYDLVYQAQEAAFALCKSGASWKELDAKSREVIAEGLVKLGIIKKKEEVNRYYPHGLGHHIGLDVHDRGISPKLKKGMVITIEPGIYIPENSPCDKKWWGIGVRIEDDLLIKETDYELLSVAAPRKAEEIEKTIAEKSALDDFVLPALKSGKKGF